MFRSCKKCGTITKHTVSPMDGQGRKHSSCDVCSNETSAMSYSDRINLDQKRATQYKEKTWSEVSDSVSRER